MAVTTHPTPARRGSASPGQGRGEELAEEVHTALRAIRSPQKMMANGKAPQEFCCFRAAGYWRSENAAKNRFQPAERTLKNWPLQGRSKRMFEAYFSRYVVDLERCENEAEDVFQRSENKKSPRPSTDPEDCTRFFILTCSPALEGT